MCFFNMPCFAFPQKTYSIENLEKLPKKELDSYYVKALKLQKGGKTTAIVGLSMVGASLLTIPLDSTGGFIAGTVVLLVGIPGVVT